MVDVASGSRASNESRTANGVPLRPLAHLAERSQLSIRWMALSGWRQVHMSTKVVEGAAEQAVYGAYPTQCPDSLHSHSP
jgi:hypothetical protein